MQFYFQCLSYVCVYILFAENKGDYVLGGENNPEVVQVLTLYKFYLPRL